MLSSAQNNVPTLTDAISIKQTKAHHSLYCILETSQTALALRQTLGQTESDTVTHFPFSHSRDLTVLNHSQKTAAIRRACNRTLLYSQIE